MASIVRLSIVNSSATVTFPPAHYGAVGLAKAITALSWPSIKSGPAGWFPPTRPPAAAFCWGAGRDRGRLHGPPAILESFFQDEGGATAIEYGLIAALISVVIIGAITAVGTQTSTTFNTISTAISGANN